MLFSILTQSFSKLTGQVMPMTGVISGVVTPKDKAISNPLVTEKSQDFIKICGNLVFAAVIKRMEFSLPKSSQRATTIKTWKLNEQ